MKIAVLYLWVRGVEQNCEAFMHIYYMGMNLMQQKKGDELLHLLLL